MVEKTRSIERDTKVWGKFTCLANNDTDLSYAGQEKKIKNLYNKKM